jgi:hypothetical protein
MGYGLSGKDTPGVVAKCVYPAFLNFRFIFFQPCVIFPTEIMATAEQIKSLIKSHFSDDVERFSTIALQLAAHEASQGHGTLAHEIHDIVDKAKAERGCNVLLKFPQELYGLVVSENPQAPIASLILAESLKNRIQRVVHEYRQQHKLKVHGLSNRRQDLPYRTSGNRKDHDGQGSCS